MSIEMDLNIDVTLLEGVRRGEFDAYEGLMRRHNQRLFRLARSVVKDDDEAMDIVQETFVTAFERIADLKEPRAFATWIARIARNESLMRLRKRRRYVQMEEEQLEQAMESSVSGASKSHPDHEVANQQLGKLLEDCIDELPDEFRTVFVMRSIEGCSTQVTADILEIKVATVKTRLHRAKKLLQGRVSAYSDIAAATVHEFAGHRCDTIVRNVLHQLRQQESLRND
jgi:RNA polymerase sigma-70 factor (ECF subfamily)